jgi:metallophosphoesterase (TIGR00282 family)
LDIRVLYIAEIIGKAGIQCVKQLLPIIKKRHSVDFVIGNINGTTNGAGIGKNHAGYLRKLGINVLTGGDKIYCKKDLVDDLSEIQYVLRPANFPNASPGRSWKTCNVKGRKITVVSILGYTGFMRIHADNPFVQLPFLIERLKKDTNSIIIDFHAATTAEKKSFAFYSDGLASAVIGSHGRVQTADERILPKGTAVITDAGRSGCINSVGGCIAKAAINEYLTGIPNWTKGEEISKETMPELQGIVFTIKNDGKAQDIIRIREPL